MIYWISHFSGCGGSTIGAIAAGFKPILGIENNLHVAGLYRNNIDSHVIWGDIEDVNQKQISFVASEFQRKQRGDILVIQTSPPCQDFSQVNRKRNKDSVRANVITKTIWQYEYLRPEYIIVENVSSFARSIPYLNFEEHILNMGYVVDKADIVASDYGVPQSRRRFFAVFSKLNYPRVSLSYLQKTAPIGWVNSISDLVPNLQPSQRLTENQKKQLDTIPSRYHSIIERVGYYNGTPKIRLQHEPCWTLRSHLADDGKKDNKEGNGRSNIIDIVLNDGSIYKVDTRVLSRFQSFPDSYKWSNSFKLNVHAIGNSIPPLLMQKICGLIRNANS